MKNVLALLVIAAAVTAIPAQAKSKDPCRAAADKAIEESRDSDATFTSKEGDTYTYSVSRGHDEACFYDINVKVKKHSDGSCTAGKAEFDGGSANCG
ncbi:MAG: hypothetical protein ACXVB9_09820 [Bdellovibrionota bacterium]